MSCTEWLLNEYLLFELNTKTETTAEVTPSSLILPPTRGLVTPFPMLR